MEDSKLVPKAFDARVCWSALLATAEAVIALRSARDLVLMGRGNTLAGASLHILYETAEALVREMGQQLVALKDAEDPGTRQFVTMLLARLHTAPATEPSKEST